MEAKSICGVLGELLAWQMSRVVAVSVKLTMLTVAFWARCSSASQSFQEHLTSINWTRSGSFAARRRLRNGQNTTCYRAAKVSRILPVTLGDCGRRTIRSYDSVRSIEVKLMTVCRIGHETVDLLDKLMVCNPRKRLTAAQALDHDYFWTDPLPADPKSCAVSSSVIAVHCSDVFSHALL